MTRTDVIRADREHSTVQPVQEFFRPFPVGYHAIHPDVSINFQMNRFCSWAGDPSMLNELRQVAPRISTYGELKVEALQLADQALAARRLLKAAAYFRLAEFYMFTDDPDKEPTRRRYLNLLAECYPQAAACRFTIPFQGTALVAYRLCPTRPRGTLVVFGGFDSYIEEEFPFLLLLRDLGFDVVAFEGPGQGTVLEDFQRPMTPDWEQPVGAVLDYFCLDDVTLLGLSLGGCLAMRAAAHEPRVRRVVAYDVLTDLSAVMLGQTHGVVRAALQLLLRLRARAVVNALVRRAMQHSRVVEWGIRQGLHVMGVQTPFELFQVLRRYQTRDVSGQVTQDVLLLAGADDHYVPSGQLTDQLSWLTGARSVTARVFTSSEGAGQHCQVGNMRLALLVIVRWIEQIGTARVKLVP